MTRKIQPVSFNLDDVYERKLRDYALEQNKYFSKYVKWLIDKHRSGELASVESRESVKNVEVAKVVRDNKPVEFSKSDVKRFL